MGLSLPGDIEPHLVDGYEWSDSGCYALNLTVPSNVRELWDNEFETTPDYVDMMADKDHTVYVGAANNVRARLEDHRDANRNDKDAVRKVNLMEVCSIDSLRNVWWFDSMDEALQNEWSLATMMQQEYDSYYVHQR